MSDLRRRELVTNGIQFYAIATWTSLQQLVHNLPGPLQHTRRKDMSTNLKNVNVKQSNAAQDARNSRLQTTVQLRKTRTEDKVKRMRNIEEDEESFPSPSYANGPSVRANRLPCIFRNHIHFDHRWITYH